MMLVTCTWLPPTWAAILPQKFSAATTLIVPPPDAAGVLEPPHAASCVTRRRTGRASAIHAQLRRALDPWPRIDTAFPVNRARSARMKPPLLAHRVPMRPDPTTQLYDTLSQKP